MASRRNPGIARLESPDVVEVRSAGAGQAKRPSHIFPRCAFQPAGNRRVDLLHGESDEAEPCEHDEPITERPRDASVATARSLIPDAADSPR